METEHRAKYVWYEGQRDPSKHLIGPKELSMPDHRKRLKIAHQANIPKLKEKLPEPQRAEERSNSKSGGDNNEVEDVQEESPQDEYAHKGLVRVNRKLTGRPAFCNYGGSSGDKITYNVQPMSGVSPSTRIRAVSNVREQDMGPPDELFLYRPDFVASQQEALDNGANESDIVGPFWVHVPSGSELPSAYADLRSFVED